jgi:hypothetical protein
MRLSSNHSAPGFVLLELLLLSSIGLIAVVTCFKLELGHTRRNHGIRQSVDSFANSLAPAETSCTVVTDSTDLQSCLTRTGRSYLIVAP